jgi:hypothetical protein
VIKNANKSPKPINIKDNIYQCNRCQKEYIYSRASGKAKIYCASCCITVRRQNIKKKILQQRGENCEICEYSICPRTLSFHHKNPKEKDFTVSANMEKSFDKIKHETDKCMILCANCHMELHEQTNGVDKIIAMLRAGKLEKFRRVKKLL